MYALLQGKSENVYQYWWAETTYSDIYCGNITICYMTGENPVSWLVQFVFINLYVYLETGLNQSTS